MHELAIAQGILQIVQQYVREDQAGAVRTVRVRVGRLAGIVPESLDFCFSAIIGDTPWKEARLHIESMPAIAECRGCGTSFGIEEAMFRCPSCGNSDISVTSGSELQVVDIEIGDEAIESS